MRACAIGFMQRTKPYLAVIWLQFGYAGMNIIATFALNQGISHYVLVDVIAIAVMALFAIIFERKVRPRMSPSTFFKILGLGFIGTSNRLELILRRSQIHVCIFQLACIFRLEKVNLKKAPSVAKVVGTLVTVAGAMIMTLIKGPALDLMGCKRKVHVGAQPGELVKIEWVKGSLMLTAGCFSWACFMILQVFTLRSYPAELSLTVLVCLAGTIEGAE